MLLKWKSFAGESFKFKKGSQYGTTTYTLNIQKARQLLFHAGIFYSLQGLELIVCGVSFYFIAGERDKRAPF
jgi:hypothetical protein